MNVRAPLIERKDSNLKIEILGDAEAVGERGASIIWAALEKKPDLLLCAASGSTPTRTYQLFVEECQAARTPGGATGPTGRTGNSPAEQLRLLKLDEWGGIPMSNPGSCDSYLREHLVQPLGLREEQYISLNADYPHPSRECRRIAQWVAENGPIDVCVLGLGLNGHLAFNEPAQELQPFAHVAELSTTSLQHPMVGGSNTKLTHGLTLGMAEILQSRKILLLITGRRKAAQFQNLTQKRISTSAPASFLWLHPQVTCLCDEEAAT